MLYGKDRSGCGWPSARLAWTTALTMFLQMGKSGFQETSLQPGVTTPHHCLLAAAVTWSLQHVTSSTPHPRTAHILSHSQVGLRSRESQSTEEAGRRRPWKGSQRFPWECGPLAARQQAGAGEAKTVRWCLSVHVSQALQALVRGAGASAQLLWGR